MLEEGGPELLFSQHELLRLNQVHGQVKKAVELPESVVGIKTYVLRADHPSQLMSVEALANVYAELFVKSNEASSSSSLESFTTAGFAEYDMQQYSQKRYASLLSTPID
jgi:hypothetical protein